MNYIVQIHMKLPTGKIMFSHENGLVAFFFEQFFFLDSEMKFEEENWDIRYNHFCPMDLGLFQALERQRVLEVLQRDKALRTIEADRIRSENVPRTFLYLFCWCSKNIYKSIVQ